MLERAIFTLFLFITGFAAYQAFARYHIRQATTNANTDPILHDLKPDVPSIVYFTTPTCVPCRTQQRPALARLQTELSSNIQIIEIDATEAPDVADRWGVFSAPTTFVLDRGGQPAVVNHGVADTNKLKRQIAGLAAADKLAV